MADDGIGHRFRIGFFEAFFIEVGRAPTIFKGSIDGFFDDRCPFFFAKRVTEQHGCRQDGGTGIGNAFTCNIRRRAVDRFIETGQFANGRLRHHTDGTGQNSRFIAQNISKKITCNNHVKPGRVGYKLHGAVIHIHMLPLHVFILF